MVFNTKPKPNTESQRPAFSLQINLSEETTRWFVGILLTITCGSGIAWVVQAPSNSVPSPTPPNVQFLQQPQ